MIVASNAIAGIIAEERYLATIDPQASVAKYGVPTGFSFGFGRDPVALGSNVETASIHGQFSVTLKAIENGLSYDRMLTTKIFMFLENIDLTLDNPRIAKALVVPRSVFLLSTSQRPNPDYDPNSRRPICGCFTSTTNSASYMLAELESDSLMLTGASGDAWDEAYFKYNILTDLALVSGKGSILESLANTETDTALSADSLSVEAVPLPPAVAFGGVTIGMLVFLARRKRAEATAAHR